MSRADWEALATEPDNGDLGYESAAWEQFETIDNTNQVIFLPRDESQLDDAAFVVAAEGAVVDLSERC